MTAADTTFAGRYGPWALVAGASDGVGAEYARRLAARGLDVVLLARRSGTLDTVAAAIRAEFGVRTRTLCVDLTEPAAADRIIDATADLRIGTFVYCAGADPNYRPFLEQPIAEQLSLVQRNCAVPLRLCHHFAGPMAGRGRGAIVLFSSMVGFLGMANMVAYGASKAFDIVLAESLWAELHGRGVDVQALVLGATDTPALRRLQVRRGQLADENASVPGAATVEQVVTESLDHLAEGPTWLVGEQVRESARRLAALPRNEAVAATLRQTGGTMRRQGAR